MVADSLYPSLIRHKDLLPEQVDALARRGATKHAVGWVVGVPGDPEAFAELVAIGDRIEGVFRSVPLYKRAIMQCVVRGDGLPGSFTDDDSPIRTVPAYAYYRTDIISDLEVGKRRVQAG